MLHDSSLVSAARLQGGAVTVNEGVHLARTPRAAAGLTRRIADDE